MERFSDGFLFGTATAAHQVEGNNTHCDCWVLEHIPHTAYEEPSGAAVDHYNRYGADIRLMAEAGFSAYRFSVEWARIEPEEGVFDESEIEHYRSVIRCCRENGIEPMVTLHHFSSPAWLIASGGWEAESTVGYFARYAAYVAEKLGGELNTICTINEANMGLQIAALTERYMRMMQRAASAEQAEGGVQMGFNMQKAIENQRLSAIEGAQAFGLSDPRSVAVFQSPRTQSGDDIICRAHEAARDAVKRICPHASVGLTLSLHDFQALPGGEEKAKEEWNLEFTHYLPYIQNDDFIGVQNYTRAFVDASGQLPPPQGAELTQGNYEYYPEALSHIIRRVAADYSGTIYVTENGIATDDDARRIDFIRTALSGVQGCIADGIPVKGYFYWSFMDNFEWQKGYGTRFGLVAVDRGTQARTPKPSLYALGAYAPAK